LVGTGVFYIIEKLNKKGDTMEPEVTGAAKAVVPAQKSEMILVGGTTIHNSQFGSTKFFQVLSHILDMEPNAGLYGIILDNTNNPKNRSGNPIYGIFIPDSMSIAINMVHHFNMAYDEGTKEKCTMSVKAITWHGLLLTILHEIHHAKRAVAAGEEKGKLTWGKEVDAEAKKWAKARLFDVAKEIDIEPPETDPFFDPLYAEFRETLEGDESEVSIFQKRLYDENIILSDEKVSEEPIDILQLKEYLRLSSDDKDDPSWNKEPDVDFINKDDAEGEIPILPEGAILPKWTDFNDFIVDEVIPYTEEVSMLGTVGEAQTVIPTAPTDNQTPWVNPVVNALETGAGTLTPTTTQGNEGERTTGQPIRINPPTISKEEQEAIVKIVNMRLYEQIFTKCGFDPNANTSFVNAGAVLEPVAIGDIPNVGQVFLTMDVVDQLNQRQNDVPIVDTIKGQVFTPSNLPGYWLWLNVNGLKAKRILVPQNPNKKNQMGYATQYAQNARKGWAVMWFIADKDSSFLKPGESNMKAKIETKPQGPTTYEVRPFG
jgi:hypothetical protein